MTQKIPSLSELVTLYSQPVDLPESYGQAVSIQACPICGSESGAMLYDLTGTPYHIVRCNGCELASMSPMPDAEAIASFYPSHYYGSEGRKFTSAIEWLVRMIGSRHAHFLERLAPAGGRVLDVGCGRGVTLHRLVESGYEAHGFEVSREATRGIDPRIEVHVADSLKEASLPDDSFDEVILWHVLEHVVEPVKLVQEIQRIVRPGGYFVVAVPNFSSWQSRLTGRFWFHLDPPRHLHQFPLETLRRMLEEAEFELRSQHHFSLRQNPFGWIQSFQNMLRWLPRNGLYEFLHRRRSGLRTASVKTWVARIQVLLLAILLAPLALGLSVVAAICRQGATVHFVVQKPDG